MVELSYACFTLLSFFVRASTGGSGICIDSVDENCWASLVNLPLLRPCARTGGARVSWTLAVWLEGTARGEIYNKVVGTLVHVHAHERSGRWLSLRSKMTRVCWSGANPACCSTAHERIWLCGFRSFLCSSRPFLLIPEKMNDRTVDSGTFWICISSCSGLWHLWALFRTFSETPAAQPHSLSCCRALCPWALVETPEASTCCTTRKP